MKSGFSENIATMVHLLFNDALVDRESHLEDRIIKPAGFTEGEIRIPLLAPYLDPVTSKKLLTR